MLPTVLFHLATVPLAWASARLLEYATHRFVFHGLGSQEGSTFSFHLDEHHVASEEHDGRDPAYLGTVFAWNANGREFWGLIGVLTVLSPISLVAPLAWVTLVACGLDYHRVHKSVHVDPEWARVHARTHWEHHFGSTWDVNWMVTTPWPDLLFGTRVVHVADGETPAEVEAIIASDPWHRIFAALGFHAHWADSVQEETEKVGPLAA